MSYGAPYGYGSGYGYGVTGFVGILDRLSVQPYSFWSTARRASSRYSGPVGRIYRTSDGTEIDVYGRGNLGIVDPNEIAAFAPTGNALWVKLYDQTGAGRHFEQASNLIMPYACKSGVPVTENGLQSAEFVAADARRMTVPSSTALYNFLHTTGGSVAAVSRASDTADNKTLLANKNSDVTQGIVLRRTGTELWYLRTGRQNVAGTPTNGYTHDASFTGTESSANTFISMLVDPDNATAGNRGYLEQNGSGGYSGNAVSATPFVENSQGDLTIGATSAGGSAWNGTISELSIWSSLIGSGDRGLLWSNASSLWGL